MKHYLDSLPEIWSPLSGVHLNYDSFTTKATMWNDYEKMHA